MSSIADFVIEPGSTIIHVKVLSNYIETAVMASDLASLLEMGFEKAKAELAVQKSAGCMLFETHRPPGELLLTSSLSARCSRMA